MVSTYLIFAVCMCGCAVHAFYLGRRTGVESTVDFLVERGVLELEED